MRPAEFEPFLRFASALGLVDDYKLDDIRAKLAAAEPPEPPGMILSEAEPFDAQRWKRQQVGAAAHAALVQALALRLDTTTLTVAEFCDKALTIGEAVDEWVAQ